MTRSLPDEFLDQVRFLEEANLAETDPILQSGFHGGPERWRSERGPILRALDRDGDLLDVAGSAVGGDPVVTSFAWMDAAPRQSA